MLSIGSREFDFYATSLPRGLGFGKMPPVAAWRGDDGLSCGVLQRHAETGVYGYTVMRRRTDHVWAVTRSVAACVSKEEAMTVIRTALCPGKAPEPVPSGVIPRPSLHGLRSRQAK